MLKSLAHTLFYRPTPADDRLYAALCALNREGAALEGRLPLPELKEALYTPKTVETWSFDLLLLDKLGKKSWPTHPPAETDKTLYTVLSTLMSRAASGREAFNLWLSFYTDNPKSDEAAALRFLQRRVKDVETTAQELATLKPADIKRRHKCLLAVAEDKTLGGPPEGDFAPLLRAQQHVPPGVALLAIPKPFRRPRGFQL
jgi:hypothetical protein